MKERRNKDQEQDMSEDREVSEIKAMENFEVKGKTFMAIQEETEMSQCTKMKSHDLSNDTCEWCWQQNLNSEEKVQVQSKQARDKVAVITLFGRLLEDELAWCKADGTDLVT